MLSIIACTHSTFAEGIKNATEMICGHQSKFYTFGFLEGDDFLEYGQMIYNVAKKEVDEGNEVLCLVDMNNATPFNSCVIALSELDVNIISGVSLPLVLELVLQRQVSKDYTRLMENVIETAKACILKTSIKEFVSQGGQND